MRIAGCILAGGRSLRMGSDKATVMLAGRSLLSHAAQRLRPQVQALIVNANSDFGALSDPVVADEMSNVAGPLAGVLAALDWAAADHQKYDALVTVPVDAPFFPLDLVLQLSSLGGTTITVASSANQLHPVFALWPIGTAETLRNWLRGENNRSAKRFIASVPHKIIDFPSVDGVDPFMNINTREDLAAAEIHMQKS